MLVSFVVWIIYRTFKKSQRRQSYAGENGLRNRLPWRRNQDGGEWNNGGMYMGDESPPMYEKGNRHNSMQSHNSMQNAGYYGADKAGSVRGLTRSNTNNTQRSMLPPMAPGSVIMIPAEQYMAMSQTQSPVDQSTMRSRMPDNFYNQSELAREPSAAYDPAQRQVNRMSDLSSLSSGFGDGDMVLPEAVERPEPAATQPRQANNFLTRFSWMSRREAGDRETVYTQSSEDRPAKYRSIGSWVNQQTGRMKRAGDKTEAGEVPPVPDIPAGMGGQEERR